MCALALHDVCLLRAITLAIILPPQLDTSLEEWASPPLPLTCQLAAWGCSVGPVALLGPSAGDTASNRQPVSQPGSHRGSAMGGAGGCRARGSRSVWGQGKTGRQ